MIAKLNVLRSVGKVGAKPREGKTVNAKIRVESIQQYSVVNSVKGRDRSRPTMTAQLRFPHMLDKLLKM